MTSSENLHIAVIGGGGAALWRKKQFNALCNSGSDKAT